MSNFLIVIVGPTAVGKTKASLQLAKVFGCDIISCDSRQMYMEMKIGTAVPSDEELAEVSHHFIRTLSIKDYYNASKFEFDVLDILVQLFKKNNIALMTGGSGLYVDAVCKGIDDLPEIDKDVRQSLEQKFLAEGIESIRTTLKFLDPDYYSRVDLKNHKRILKALEVCIMTGRPYSAFLTNKEKKRDFNMIRIGLNMPREELYQRINQRVELMIEQGLEDEARELYPLFLDEKPSALNTVGYKEFFQYFEGKINREEVIDLIKRNTRKYARKQLTWFRKDELTRWFHPSEVNQMVEYVQKTINDSDKAL